jgi:hypothetical protein
LCLPAVPAVIVLMPLSDMLGPFAGCPLARSWHGSSLHVGRQHYCMCHPLSKVCSSTFILRSLPLQRAGSTPFLETPSVRSCTDHVVSCRPPAENCVCPAIDSRS